MPYDADAARGQRRCLGFCRRHRYSLLRPYFSDTNGTAEPGTIVVGSTPFQRSACTSVTRLGLVPSARARASMAAAWASPVILMFEAWASPFSLVASALACASARTALAFALACVTVVWAWTFSRSAFCCSFC